MDETTEPKVEREPWEDLLEVEYTPKLSHKAYDQLHLRIVALETRQRALKNARISDIQKLTYRLDLLEQRLTDWRTDLAFDLKKFEDLKKRQQQHWVALKAIHQDIKLLGDAIKTLRTPRR